MTVAFDAKSSAASNTLSPTSPTTHTNMTVGSSLSNGALLCFITFTATTAPTITGVHWDSTGTNQAMTLVSGTSLNDVANVGFQNIYALAAPTAGNKTLSVTYTGSATLVTIYCVSFSGVNQTTPCINGTNAKNDVGSGTSSITITSPTGDIAVAFHANDTGGTFSATSGTQLFINNFGTDENTAGNYTTGSGTTVTLTATLTSTLWNVVGCDVSAATAATPFVQKDWPLPTPPNREPTLLSWIQAYKLLLYQGKDVLPTRQLEWQVPRSVEPYPYRSWEAKYNPNLIGKDVLPRNQLEWQVPRSPEPYPYRSWEAFYNRNLIGLDKFYDGPGNGPDFDYPLPKSPEPFPYRTWTQNLLQTTLAPTLAKPFNQYDWQVPVGAEPNWRRSWEFWFNYNLIGQDQFPVRQLDWQLPTAPPKIDQTWIVNLQLSTLAPVVTTVPFRQFDWPLPQGYAPLVQAGSQPLNLSLQPPFMMIPFQWDIAEGPTFINPSSSQNLLLTTLAPPPSSGIPFRQLDWRLPDFFLQ